MKKGGLNQAGAGHILVIVAVVALVIIGIVGWRVLQQGNDNSGSQTTVQEEKSDEITDEKGLENAQNELDASQIDLELDTSELDAAENDLL